MERLKLINSLLRILQSFKETVFPKYVMNEQEIITFQIIEKLSEDSNSTFKIAPLSNAYYISNDILGYNVKISEQEIIIVNHNFSTFRKFPLEFHEIVLHLVRKYVENDRAMFEEEIFSSEVEVLKKIKNKIDLKTK